MGEDDGNEEKLPGQKTDQGLFIPPMLSGPVSDRPLDDATRQLFGAHLEFLSRNRTRLPEAGERGTLFAFRCGKSFVVTELSKEYGSLDSGGPLELVDFDPITGRTLSVGKGRTPASSPIIWWGFKMFVRTNFALLLLSNPPKKTPQQPSMPYGVGLAGKGRRYSIWQLSEMNFPTGPMIDAFTTGKPSTPEDPACNLDETEVEFSDGTLHLVNRMERFMK